MKRSHDRRHPDLEFTTEVESGKVSSTHNEQGRQRIWDLGCSVRDDEQASRRGGTAQFRGEKDRPRASGR
jgi:hypothetical protein